MEAHPPGRPAIELAPLLRDVAREAGEHPGCRALKYAHMVHGVDDAGHTFFDGQLVEFCRETFGGAPRIAEDDRGAVGEDSFQNLGVDRRPDGRARITHPRTGHARPRPIRCSLALRTSEIGHVLDRDDDLDLKIFTDASIDDLHWSLNTRLAEPTEELRRELVQHVRKEIGPIATPDKIQYAPALPKTRSGKIMRRILRKIAENAIDQIGDTTTLADPSVVDALVEGRD